MKAVMLSINPKWCELIASGRKTVEVRKTRPKLDTPFKCYIYCTKDKSIRLFVDEWHEDYTIPHIANGKVIGEFVCDFVYENIGYDSQGTCLSADELKRYANGKPLYGWHISDLVIYGKPKELSEFRTVCQYRNDGGSCKYDKIDCDCSKFDFNPDYSVAFAKCCDYMDRPPQSWCYVEELSV